VKFGDGCATVTGYKLPQPLVHQIGKAGVRFEPEVRISVWLCSSWSRCAGQLLRQEKDEASPFRLGVMGSVECLHSPFCRG
jgi:hypothetical protein